MKLLSLTLAACMVAGYAQAQTPSQTPEPAQSSATAPASSSHESCKKEVKKLCGHAHGQEMKDCIKSGLDMNKFSAECKTKLAEKAESEK